MTMDEFAQALGSMDPVELALGAGVLAALGVLVVVGQILWFFISAIGYRKMFMKAGEAGWKAFIPYYKDFVCFKLAWNTNMFWPFMASVLLMQLLPEEGKLVLSLITLAVVVVRIVLNIKLDIRVAASFGKTKGWGVLLFFFPFVISLILGYGKADYIGNTTVAGAVADDAAIGE